jgi:tryptophan synthase alpha chain
MMSRLASTFAHLRSEPRVGLVTYVTAGDPDLARSADIVRALARAGADVLEVGVPFSDPVADGPVIQRAAERALAAGGSLAASLGLVASVRGDVEAPIVLFTYANPVFRLGVSRFAERAASAGVDGVLVLDLPVEEADAARRALVRAGIDMIFLLSPTTSDDRISAAARAGSGFLYAVSRLGVTGPRDVLADGAEALVRRIRERSPLPVALGFGISRPEHVRQVGQWADAAVVGSGLVQVVAEAAGGPDLLPRVTGYVKWLKGEQDGARVSLLEEPWSS